MNTAYRKKVIAITMLLAAALILVGVMLMATTECSCAAVNKNAVKKAKTYKKAANKIFTVNGAKYCFAKKKVKKGIQKVGKAYYFFSKSTGKMEKNKTVKVSGKYWFFQKNGKRYKYSFKKAGDANANTAAGIVIAGAKIKTTGKGSEAELRKAYRYIITKTGYDFLTPDLSSKSWIGKAALRAAKDRKAKCYGHAAITYSVFRALGAAPSLMLGKCNSAPSKPGSKPTEHSWVEINTEDGAVAYDTVFDAEHSNKDMSFYAKKMTKNEDGTFSVEGKNYIYYMEKKAA